ncbi:MAG: KH domain-containing protein [Candidatus Nanohaloarchaea archaeon]|nr:KH domain-containing protein [Candidatus Nanohaloarchaea archaeon]
MRVVRIPDERVAVLIGEDGSTLEEIQDLTNTDLTVDDNEVTVEGDDPLQEMTARDIVKAIGRGFAPEKALRLLEDNAGLAVINVKDFTDTDNGQERLKGRVIGRDGEAKQHIQKETNTELAVYGKTVSILGPLRGLEVAKKAVEMLLDGSSHATAYQYLDQNKAQTI